MDLYTNLACATARYQKVWKYFYVVMGQVQNGQLYIGIGAAP